MGWLEREGRTHDIIPSSSLRGHSSGISKRARRLLLRLQTRPEQPALLGGFKLPEKEINIKIKIIRKKELGEGARGAIFIGPTYGDARVYHNPEDYCLV